jgi:hypothetical protein
MRCAGVVVEVVVIGGDAGAGGHALYDFCDDVV